MNIVTQNAWLGGYYAFDPCGDHGRNRYEVGSEAHAAHSNGFHTARAEFERSGQAPEYWKGRANAKDAFRWYKQYQSDQQQG